MAVKLRSEARETIDNNNKRSRLENNSRALIDYGRNFGNRALDILKEPKLTLNFNPVLVRVTPDMYFLENKKQKMVKLEFGKYGIEQEMVNIICQCLFEAQLEFGYGLTSSSVLYWDIARGVQVKGARLGSRRRKQIEAACKTITSMWSGINKNE